MGQPLSHHFHAEEWSCMNPVEYKPARRGWIREVLVRAAAGIISALVLEALTAAAHWLV